MGIESQVAHSRSLPTAPMLVPLLGLIAGILSVDFEAGRWWWAVVPGVAAVGFYILISVCASASPGAAWRWHRWHPVWIGLFFIAVGMVVTCLATPQKLPPNGTTIAYGRGKVVEISHLTTGDVLTVNISSLADNEGRLWTPWATKARVYTAGISAQEGDYVKAYGDFKSPEVNPNRFDNSYLERWRRSGIAYTARVEGKDLEIEPGYTSLDDFATGCRLRIGSTIGDAGLQPATAGFLSAMILGDKTHLDPEFKAAFADVGLSHVLALSGMHVAIISLVFLWLLIPLNFLGKFKWRLAFTLLLLCGYGFLTGWHPSTLRSILMYGCVIIAIILERKRSAWNALLAATFFILLFRPDWLNDVGLQMSFMCVALLIFFVEPFNSIAHKWHPRTYKVVSFLLTSMIAGIGIWVYCSHIFGRVPIFFMLANIVILPLLPFYLLTAIGYLCVAATGIKCHCIGLALDKSLGWVQSFFATISNGGSSSLEFQTSELSVWLWMLFLVALALAVNDYKRKTATVLSGVLFAATSLSLTADYFNTSHQGGVIVQQCPFPPKVLYAHKGKETIVALHPHTGSIINCGGIRLIHPARNFNLTVGAADTVLLSGTYADFNRVLDRLTTLRPALVILHNSVPQSQCATLQSALDSARVPYHDIRTSGPWRKEK